MRLTPSERDRLLIVTTAELARRRLARGLRLNVPDATALTADTVCEAARDGRPGTAGEESGERRNGQGGDGPQLLRPFEEGQRKYPMASSGAAARIAGRTRAQRVHLDPCDPGCGLNGLRGDAVAATPSLPASAS